MMCITDQVEVRFARGHDVQDASQSMGASPWLAASNSEKLQASGPGWRLVVRWSLEARDSGGVVPKYLSDYRNVLC